MNRSASSSWMRNTRHTYKQEEAPRYHARDVAVMRGQMESASSCSAPPRRRWRVITMRQPANTRCSTLTQRVDNKKMPLIRVVDMRQDGGREKQAAIFSEQTDGSHHRSGSRNASRRFCF